MALGKWISNLKGLFEEGPMKELTEHVAEEPQVKLFARTFATVSCSPCW